MRFLKYWYYRIMCNFACKSKKEYYKSMKYKYKVALFSKSKICVQGKNNEYDVFKIKAHNINLTINGDNNKVIIGDGCWFNNVCNIFIRGDNNKIIIGDVCFISHAGAVSFTIGNMGLTTTNSALLSVGDGTFINGAYIQSLENNSEIIIGKNCMLSTKILIYGTDYHSILDLEGRLLNYGKKVVIGDNCWIGNDVKITKKAFIPNNTIVGIGSVVSSKFEEENTVIAGNPAKVVKRGVKFDRLAPNVYLEKHPEAIV